MILIGGNILTPLKITPVRKNGFIDYMKSVGKLGGQNKVPRLSNDRKIADELAKWTQRTDLLYCLFNDSMTYMIQPIRRIAIFGSTGSIGTQALEVIAANP